MSNKKRRNSGPVRLDLMSVYPAALFIPVLGGPSEAEDLTHMIISMCEYCTGSGLDGFVAHLDQQTSSCNCPPGTHEINRAAIIANVTAFAECLRRGTGVTT